MTLQDLGKRYRGIQTLLKNIDTDGCLFLCLCSIIEEVTGKPADLIMIIKTSIAKGWLSLDYEVKDALALLNCFTGKRFKRKIMPYLPTYIHDNEFSVEKWFNPDTKYEHFKRRFTDTLLNSVTVAKGYIKEYYIYYYE